MCPRTPQLNEYEELRLAVEEELSRHFHRDRRVVSLRRRISPYSSSCLVQNLAVKLEDGHGLRLILKDLSPSSLLPGGRVRPQFLYDRSREVEIYRNLLSRERFGTAIFYGASANEFSRCWLFLERVEGPLLWQLGGLDPWKDAAVWLARLHSDFAPLGRPKAAKNFPHLLQHDADYYRLWLHKAELFLRQRARGSKELRRKFRRLAGRYDQVVERLTRLPRTFIHGEFYPSNIIVQSGARARRICPIDWEVAALAPGLIDLAALTSGDWSPSQKRAMVEAYRCALAPANGETPSVADLLEAVDFCQLHLAVQWLGWAVKWSPPAHQANNWLGEACRLADKLGL